MCAFQLCSIIIPYIYKTHTRACARKTRSNSKQHQHRLTPSPLREHAARNFARARIMRAISRTRSRAQCVHACSTHPSLRRRRRRRRIFLPNGDECETRDLRVAAHARSSARAHPNAMSVRPCVSACVCVYVRTTCVHECTYVCLYYGQPSEQAIFSLAAAAVREPHARRQQRTAITRVAHYACVYTEWTCVCVCLCVCW